MITLGKSRFTSELQVRPDDIDMNNHVHASRYFDYVLAARHDQMERCYRMGMDQFLKRGLGWYVRESHIEYKRPLKIGEFFVVTTWIDEIYKDGVQVQFEITRKTNHKLSANGYCVYTLVNLKTGRAEAIPPDITAVYSV